MRLNLRVHFISTILCLILFVLSLYGITLIWRLQSLIFITSLITFILTWKYASKDNIKWLKTYLKSMLFLPVVLSIISCILGGGLLFIHFLFYSFFFILGGNGESYSKETIKITPAFALMTNEAYNVKRNYFLFYKTIGHFQYEDYDESMKITPLPNEDTINMLLIEKPEGKVDTVTITH